MVIALATHEAPATHEAAEVDETENGGMTVIVILTEDTDPDRETENGIGIEKRTMVMITVGAMATKEIVMINGKARATRVGSDVWRVTEIEATKAVAGTGEVAATKSVREMMMATENEVEVLGENTNGTPPLSQTDRCCPPNLPEKRMSKDPIAGLQRLQ